MHLSFWPPHSPLWWWREKWSRLSQNWMPINIQMLSWLKLVLKVGWRGDPSKPSEGDYDQALRRMAGILLGESEGHRPTRSQQTSGTCVSSMGNTATWGTLAGKRSSWRSCDVKPVVCCTVKNSGSRRGCMLEQTRAIHSQSYQSNDPAPLTRCLKSCSETLTKNCNAPLYHYRRANNDVLHLRITFHTRDSYAEGLEWTQGTLGTYGIM